jgi:hypothetical protein
MTSHSPCPAQADVGDSDYTETPHILLPTPKTHKTNNINSYSNIKQNKYRE